MIADHRTQTGKAENIADHSSVRGERLVSNVLWNWLFIAFSVPVALVFSPYIIRKLGADGYGMWVLASSLIGYYTMLDFGSRSAVVRYCAHYRATGEHGRINELMSTVVAGMIVIVLSLVPVTMILSHLVNSWFNIPPSFHHVVPLTVLLLGLGAGLGLMSSLFSGLVDGFQRFDVENQNRIVAFVIQYVGGVVVLALGYGLVAMGLLALVAGVVSVALYRVRAKQVFPALRLSWRLVRYSALCQVFRFGMPTLLSEVARQCIQQNPIVLIGYYLAPAFVGFYSLPVRLLQTAADVVSRVGIVAGPQAAELLALGRPDLVARLGTYANRYCLTLYTPLGIMGTLYGQEILQLWVGSEFGARSGPVLAILVAGGLLAQAGQFSSSAILFGLGRHAGFAYGLLGEAAVSLAGMILIVPRFGIVGAAVLSAVLMVAVRGLLTPWMLCRYLGANYGSYMASIFVRPLLTALPIWGLVHVCKLWVWPGQSWLDVIAAACFTGVIYFGAAVQTCLDHEHRLLVLNWLSRCREQISLRWT